MKRSLLVLAAAATVAALLPALLFTAKASGSIIASVRAPTAALFRNCTGLNRKYPHGVGKYGARDHTKSGDPVTNFKRSNILYRTNRGLDRDKDGIACEKK